VGSLQVYFTPIYGFLSKRFYGKSLLKLAEWDYLLLRLDAFAFLAAETLLFIICVLQNTKYLYFVSHKT